MAFKSSGHASTDIQVNDLSVLIKTGGKGISALVGVTERGEIGKSKLIGSWTEYRRHFGNLHNDTVFPHLCKIMLDHGCKIRVCPVGHYTDPSDAQTLVGTAATGTIGTTGAVDGIIYTARRAGVWGNSVTVAHTAAASGAANKIDITITYAPDNIVITIKDINTTLTATDINRINAENDLLTTTSAVGDVVSTAAATALTTGAEDLTAIVAADYVGDQAAETGIFGLDNAPADFVRVAIPAVAIPAVDIAVINYAIARMDCRAWVRTPLGITGSTAVEYRNRTGSYSGTKPDTWLGSMVYGTVAVTEPITQVGTVDVTPLPHVMALAGVKDSNQFPWFATAGAKRGKLRNVVSVGYNLGSPAKSTEWDTVDEAGINAVIWDDTYGPVYYGNGTLQVESTLLSHENVAELIIYLIRAIKPISRRSTFDPNDIQTWKDIFAGVNPILKYVKDNRGVWDYIYDGDQLIDNISEAVVNSPENIDNGQYLANIWIQPKVGMKYIGIGLMITNSSINLQELQGQPA